MLQVKEPTYVVETIKDTEKIHISTNFKIIITEMKENEYANKFYFEF